MTNESRLLVVDSCDWMSARSAGNGDEMTSV
jgi:hypothetical protein